MKVADSQHPVRAGVHVSIAGGVDKAPDRAAALGCETFQIFSRSPRGGKPRPLTEGETNSFQAKREKYGMGPVAVHVPYFFNLAATEEHFFEAAKEILATDLARADRLGAEYLVLHGGSHKGTGLEQALERLIDGLRAVMTGYSGKTMVLLENQAGSGSEIVFTFEEISYVLNSVPFEMGVCFDTCHGFAAGYNLQTPDAVGKVMSHFDRTIGLKRLKMVHCNDSKFPLGSHKDRHEQIGLGEIGVQGMWGLVRHAYLRTVPFILETPYENEDGQKRNLDVIKNLSLSESIPSANLNELIGNGV